jgi:primosomal protein N' (replication factor Y)
MERKTYFVDVILPVKVPNLYTYRVPFELNFEIKVGQRVVVQFGGRGVKQYTALVRNVHENPPKAYVAKYIESVLDDLPIVNVKQFKLWEWIAGYYMCTIGEVMSAALPGSLQLASETRIVLDPEFARDYDVLTDKEYLIVEALELQEVLTLKEIASILQQKTVYPLIKSLIEKRAILVEEELNERYKPKMAAYVQLAEKYEDEEELRLLFDHLEADKRSHRQLEVLMSYIQLHNRYEKKRNEVKKSQLVKSTGGVAGPLKTLIKKGIIEEYEREIGRIGPYDGEEQLVKDLTESQEVALGEIKAHFEEKDVVLLHGVTSSGKTEVYVKMMEKAVAEGKQVLYLLPEIALTTQIITRLKKYFGDSIGVYHSKFNQNERVEIWNKVLEKVPGEYDIILGARSAMFLPFKDLGLVIVDEEHETTFKQYDPAPRYNARDSAIVMAAQHKAKVILGSATPSVESYWNASEGRYGLVEMTKRFGGVQLPEILCADVKEATRKKKMHSHFSEMLLVKMKSVVANGEQVILFQNRRGYSPMWSCEMCAWTPFCKNCDVSVTYHKHSHHLRCHYCGYSIEPPTRCGACGSAKLKMLGFGTEKVEEELTLFMPGVRVARMDLDTTRSKNAYSKIITDFEDRQIDILVGTQMVTKGLDFDNVALVGVLNADSMLNFPDFRANERAYQLMAQVSGRAGRNKKRGTVIIQTYNPNHWIIHQVIANDYHAMYRQEVIERRNFNYPPFHRLIGLTLKHRDRDMAYHASAELAKQLRVSFGRRVLGPEPPLVGKVKNQYLMKILVKMERELSVRKMKHQLQAELDAFMRDSIFKGLRILVDVDPL